MHPIALIGSRGMLGRAVRLRLSAAGATVREFNRPQVDLEASATLDQAVAEGATVINCAAWTDVDAAEAHEAAATKVNAEAVAQLANLCAARGCTLVHFSTDYVFDGTSPTPYSVGHPRAPLNAYGRSKASGEVAIEASGCEHLLVRTSWLYAPWGRNFVRTIADISSKRPTIEVVDDQRGRPTSATYLAERTLELMGDNARGTFHVADGGECSWFQFACAIVGGLGRACVVNACSSDAFPRPAARPAFSLLDLSDTEALVGPSPHWKDNLDVVLQVLRRRQ